jgi:hypothetical protein
MSGNALLANQVDEYAYNFCDICGGEFTPEELDLHHEGNAIAACGEKAINAPSHMLACFKCKHGIALEKTLSMVPQRVAPIDMTKLKEVGY